MKKVLGIIMMLFVMSGIVFADVTKVKKYNDRTETYFYKNDGTYLKKIIIKFKNGNTFLSYIESEKPYVAVVKKTYKNSTFEVYKYNQYKQNFYYRDIDGTVATCNFHGKDENSEIKDFIFIDKDGYIVKMGTFDENGNTTFLDQPGANFNKQKSNNIM